MDRLAVVYVSHPLVRLVGREPQRCVPILAYHSVSDNLFGISDPFRQTNTSPRAFARQMKWLSQGGYRTMGLDEMLAAIEAGADLSKRVVITFDDGYRDFYTDAFPVMRQCGLNATVYLTTDRIRDMAARVEGADYLTWREVRELQTEGVHFGSHTVTHPDLRSLGPEQIEYELACSKERIEQNIGVAVRSFSYPFAFPEEDKDFTRFLEGVLENQEFENGVASIFGRARDKHNKFFLPRLPVNTWDDQLLFRAKLEGGYDWMRWPQLLKRTVFHNVTSMQRAASAET
jgi:peptidoglycan/xylan/chitin deacetylase (PgdA/CDA1 family)